MKNEVYQLLNKLHIQYDKVEHPPLFTCEDNEKYNIKFDAISFGNENVLEEKLGIKIGAVSIFNIINLKDKDIMFILDEDILKCEKVGFHPNINTETVIFNPQEIHKIFECYNVKYKFIEI